MTEAKRIRRSPLETQRLILDATEKVMVDEGYAAATSRQIAKVAGLTSALVHYYYPTTDDVFIALHKRMSERQTAQLKSVLQSDNPLRTLWEFQTKWEHAALGVEFIALANHRKSIRNDIVRQAEHARSLQEKALAPLFSAKSPTLGPLNAASAATLLMSAARMLVNEKSIGITHGHDDVHKFVEWALDQLATRPSGPAPKTSRQKPSTSKPKSHGGQSSMTASQRSRGKQ